MSLKLVEWQYQVDCDKLCLSNVIPRATTKKAKQWGELKNAIDEQKLNFKNLQKNHKKPRKRKQKQGNRINRQQK